MKENQILNFQLNLWRCKKQWKMLKLKKVQPSPRVGAIEYVQVQK